MHRKKIKIRMIILLAFAAILVMISLLAPFLCPHDPYQTSAVLKNKAPSMSYPFGTDFLGRCVLSRVLMGSRNTIFASLFLVLVSFLFCSFAGMVSGYYGGVIDTLLMRLADSLLAFPQMVLAIAVAALLGGSLVNAMIALGITSWTIYARLARTHTISLKNETFIAAEKLAGCSDFRILFWHILPNMAGSLIVNASTQIGTTIIGIAGLSFLGLGVELPKAEWGAMINDAKAYIQLAPWAVLFPATAIVVTIMIFNYLGDTCRDLADVNEVKF